MAKQSGIHQLRGKVGEHSYYRQTGVSTGLVRSINQGLSARVKSGEEYVNTRLNNAEFGQAGAIASCVAKLIVPKFRPMMLPFSQSKMAKIILDVIKTDSAPWGQRNLNIDNVSDTLESALLSVRKNDSSNTGVYIEFSDDDNGWIAKFNTPIWTSFLQSIGADGATLSLIAARPFIGKTTNGFGRTPYYPCVPNFNILSVDANAGSADENFPSTPDGPTTPQSAFYLGSAIAVAVIMPYRTIDSVNHILQEYCTYVTTTSTTESE